MASRLRRWALRMPPLLALTLMGCAATHQGGPSNTPSSGGAAPTPAFPWGGGGAKIGYIRSDVISQRLPEYRDADNTLNAENNQWQAEAARMESDIKTKEAEIEELKLILTPERRKDLEEALNKMRKELAAYRQNTWYDENSRYLKRRKELMAPIDARVNDAIWKVAESAGVDIVLDTVAGNVVYAKPALDLTDRVLEELQK